MKTTSSLTDDFKDVSTLANVVIDLRYAGTNNFTKTDVYRDFQTAYLHELAYKKLSQASQILATENPSHRFIVFDALRPLHTQSVLFSFVSGTSQEPFIANPLEGSVHCYGFAVDLSLLAPDGKELDMGTGFDDFSELSAPRSEERFLEEGLLSQQQLANRRLLRECMVRAGFIQEPSEWWHFDAIPIAEAKSRYLPFDNS